MSSNAERLARAVLQRREELDRTQLDVWQAGGPSNTTLTAIENGLTESLTRTTARKLDKGLRWQEGSARTVWLGGDPTPLDDAGEIADEIEASGLGDATKAFLLRLLAEERAREQRERGRA